MLAPMRIWTLALPSILLLVACQAPRPASEPSGAEVLAPADSSTSAASSAQATVDAPPHPEAPARESRPEAVAATPGSRTEAAGDDFARALAFARADDRTIELLKILCEEHAPRLTGSRKADAACEWARAQFESFGLEARLETWGMAAARFDRGPSFGRVLGDEPLELDFMTASWTVGTQGARRGPARLEPRDQAELDAVGEEALRGAWLVRVDERLDAAWRKRLDELHDRVQPLGLLRAGAKSGLLVMSGDFRAQSRGKRPTVRVRFDQHEELVRRLRAGARVELEFQIDNRFEDGPVPCSNVVADLVGSEFPDEYVIVQGHLDTWDGAQGAQDNGTGVATTMEAARVLAQSGVRPRRTIRFVLYTGEEQGLYGSQGYVRDHADELARTSIVLNHDGGGTFLAGLDATYAMLPDMQPLAERLRGLDARRPFELREVEALRNSGDSDHAPFVGAGVPAFFWKQSERDYTFVHHTQNDTFANVPLDEVRHSSKVVMLAALHFANLDRLLDRTDMEPLPRRMLGVRLGEDATIERVEKDGRGAAAGLLVGDRVVELDGAKVADRADLVEKLQGGGARKSCVALRGEARLELVLDWSADSDERRRAERAARRAERAKAGGASGAAAGR